MADLTEKQKRFADYYIETANATESYKVAGYSCNNDNVAGVEGFKLLRNPKIKNYINEKMNKKDNDRIASQDEVLKYFTSLMRGEETDEIVAMNPGIGFDRTEQRVDSKTRLAAAKELAKRYGIDKPSIDSNSDEVVQIVFKRD
ncbi:MAG: terminase small subunit [Cetobacterium sp.]